MKRPLSLLSFFQIFSPLASLIHSLLVSVAFSSGLRCWCAWSNNPVSSHRHNAFVYRWDLCGWISSNSCVWISVALGTSFAKVIAIFCDCACRTSVAEVREETGKALENIVIGQCKHEIQDEYTSSGKSMVPRVGKWESKEIDFHSLVQHFNGEVKVLKEKFENLKMTRTRNEDVERPIEGFKVEEILDKVVTRVWNRSPVFVGFSVILYNKDFPCEMFKFFAFLIALSCMGIILVGGLATLHFWAIKVDLYENLNTKKKGGSRSQANTSLPLSGESRAGESTHDNTVGVVSSDIENGDNCHRFSTFWKYAWPHVIESMVVLIIELVFVLAIGISQKMRCLNFTFTNTS